MASAVEELVRFDSPVERTITRWVAADSELGGQTLRRGELVIAVVGSANRDGAQFAGADALDLARADNKHVGFGRGPHYCLGAPLARLETEIALETLLRALAEPSPRNRGGGSLLAADPSLPQPRVAPCQVGRLIAAVTPTRPRASVRRPRDDDRRARVAPARTARLPYLAVNPHLALRPQLTDGNAHLPTSDGDADRGLAPLRLPEPESDLSDVEHELDRDRNEPPRRREHEDREQQRDEEEHARSVLRGRASTPRRPRSRPRGARGEPRTATPRARGRRARGRPSRPRRPDAARDERCACNRPADPRSVERPRRTAVDDVVRAKRGERLPLAWRSPRLPNVIIFSANGLTAFAFASVVWIRPCSIRAPRDSSRAPCGGRSPARASCRIAGGRMGGLRRAPRP